MKTKILKIIAVFSVLTFTSFSQTQVKLNKKLKNYAAKITTEFNLISAERKKTLTELGDFILEDKLKKNKATLTFICTSNSRRSHMAQVWMQTAAIYYGIDSINTFSGGTEATEVNKRAVTALKRAGFTITRTATEFNSPYLLAPGSGAGNWLLYSKKYDNFQNPKSNFIAVMVCSEADKSCPMVPGANGRIGLPYEDPKYYDNTPSEQQKYDETCRLIARELFFVADYVKAKLILKNESAKNRFMYKSIENYCTKLVGEFQDIPNHRKQILEKITEYISKKIMLDKPINLIYICTHNSRRSHFGQVWAKVASEYYNIKNVNTFSGGTEATAFNINAINALKRIGFEIKPIKIDKNPTYRVIFGDNENPIECFSKVYDNPKNPQSEFAAIMTCSDAEENCPFIPGVELRIGTTYDDPKAFDDTAQQDEKYSERCRQIALETLYVFSKVK